MNSPVLPVRVDQIARTAWPYQSGSSVYGMIRNVGRLMDDPRFKPLAAKHEEQLAIRRFGRFAKASRFSQCGIELAGIELRRLGEA